MIGESYRESQRNPFDLRLNEVCVREKETGRVVYRFKGKRQINERGVG